MASYLFDDLIVYSQLNDHLFSIFWGVSKRLKGRGQLQVPSIKNFSKSVIGPAFEDKIFKSVFVENPNIFVFHYNYYHESMRNPFSKHHLLNTIVNNTKNYFSKNHGTGNKTTSRLWSKILIIVFKLNAIKYWYFRNRFHPV